jgi:flagellar hook-length control protein FliK
LPGGTHTITVPTPVGAAAFGEDFSARIALLARGRVHSAELSLTPADLGPVSVSIELRGTDATLVFGAAHAATRAAIEDALPRLREMLDAQGLQLADARVGTQTGNGASRDNDRGAPPSPGTAPRPIESVAAAGAVPHVAARPLRLIDVIA